MSKNGRVPFTVLSILILIGAIAASAYQGSFVKEVGKKIFKSDVECILEWQTAEIESIAFESANKVIEESITNGYSEALLWEMNIKVYDNFTKFLKKYPYYTSNYKIEVSEPKISVGTIPIEYEGTNFLGMNVIFVSPGGFRIKGGLNIELTDLKTNKRIEGKIEVDRIIPNVKPFLIEQYARFRIDTSDEGLLSEIAEDMLNIPAKLDTNYEIDEEKVLSAIDYSIALEEAIIYRDTCKPEIHKKLMEIQSISDVFLKNFYPYDYNFGSYWVEGGNRDKSQEITLDLSNYAKPYKFKAGKDIIERSFTVKSSWVKKPEIEIKKREYASKVSASKDDVIYSNGIEVDENAVVWDIYITDGLRFLSIWEKNLVFAKEIEFNTRLRVSDFGHKAGKNDGRDRAEIEDRSFFEKEFSMFGEKRYDTTATIINGTGIPFQFISAKADMYLDGIYIGRFDPSQIYLKGLLENKHRIDATLIYDDGRVEVGNLTFDPAIDSHISIYLSEKYDTSLFWQIALTYLKGTNAKDALPALLELFSFITGYPFPKELKYDAYNHTDEIISWCDGYIDYLDSSEKDFTYTTALPITTLKVIAQMVKIIEKILTIIKETLKSIVVITEVTITFSYVETEIAVFAVRDAFGNSIIIFSYRYKAVDGTFYIRNEKTYSETATKIGLIGSLIGIAIICFSLYTDIATIQQEGLNVYNIVRLAMDVILLIMTIYKAVSAISQIAVSMGLMSAKIGSEVALKWIPIISAIIGVIILFWDEYKKNEGDLGATLSSLFLGLDRTTIVWYASLVALIITIWAVLSIGGPVGWIIAAIASIVVVIIWVVLYWDDIVAWWNNVVKESDVEDVAKSITKNLKTTANLVGTLNDQDLDTLFSIARWQRGLGYNVLLLSLYTSDQSMHKNFFSMSKYYFDLSSSLLDKVKKMHYVRFWVIVFWRQVDDFCDGRTDYDDKTELSERFGFDDPSKKWNGEIKIKNKNTGFSWVSLHQGIGNRIYYINNFLLSLNYEVANSTEIKYEVSGKDKVWPDGMQVWGDTLKKIGDELTNWNEALSIASERVEYTIRYPYPTKYENKYGVIVINVDPNFDDMTFELRRTDGNIFEHFFSTMPSPESSSSVSYNMHREGGLTSPGYIYVEANELGTDYTLEVKKRNPDYSLEDDKKSFKVYPFHSSNFGSKKVGFSIKPESVSFEIKNYYKNNVSLYIVVTDKSGKEIDVPIINGTYNISTIPKQPLPIKENLISEGNKLYIRAILEGDATEYLNVSLGKIKNDFYEEVVFGIWDRFVSWVSGAGVQISLSYKLVINEVTKEKVIEKDGVRYTVYYHLEWLE